MRVQTGNKGPLMFFMSGHFADKDTDTDVKQIAFWSLFVKDHTSDAPG